LAALAADADAAAQTALGELGQPMADERRQVLYDFNATKTAYPRDALAHQLFEAQARRTPQAIALAYEDRRLSYAELDALSNRLARHLAGLGVGPDARVALCVDRGIEMVVGVLGVL
ncbi:AMP-binding protein, partial [Streptomyces sp. S12]|nr:AMP-binding protein [Streptomyces sp. S12]